MSTSFKWDITSLLEGLEQLRQRTEAALITYGNTSATNLEGYMKQNAVWTDRTGEARRRLSGKCEKVENGIRITLAHGVDYGMWLEIAHEKRYAIIEPTIRLKSQEVLDGLNGLLEGMGMKRL